MKHAAKIRSVLFSDLIFLTFVYARRNSEERKPGNLSFETAIQGTYRSQSHHDLNPASPPNNIIWKTPSIEHIDRLRRLNKSQEHLKSALQTGVAMRSPAQKRQPRPAALFDDRLSFSSGEEELDQLYNR